MLPRRQLGAWKEVWNQQIPHLGTLLKFIHWLTQKTIVPFEQGSEQERTPTPQQTPPVGPHDPGTLRHQDGGQRGRTSCDVYGRAHGQVLKQIPQVLSKAMPAGAESYTFTATQRLLLDLVEMGPQGPHHRRGPVSPLRDKHGCAPHVHPRQTEAVRLRIPAIQTPRSSPGPSQGISPSAHTCLHPCLGGTLTAGGRKSLQCGPWMLDASPVRPLCLSNSSLAYPR